MIVPCTCNSTKDVRSKQCQVCHAFKKSLCCRCKERPKTNTYGKGLCDTCRSSPIIREVLCRRCRKNFETTTGNRICNPCSYKKSGFDKCPKCSNDKDRRAKQCKPCYNSSPNKGGGRPIDDNKDRIYDSNGYVLIRAKDGKGRRLREHRYIMEQRLGRKLFPNEEVHHKNGQRDDNNPSNLELWAKSQPAGQRVKDLLDWAHKLIDLYEGTVE